YLLDFKRALSDAIKNSTRKLSEANYLGLISAGERDLADRRYCMKFEAGESARNKFEQTYYKYIMHVFDNYIAHELVYNRERFNHQEFNMRQFPKRHNKPLDLKPAKTPPSLVKKFTIRVKIENKWIDFFNEDNNFQRLRKILIDKKISGI